MTVRSEALPGEPALPATAELQGPDEFGPCVTCGRPQTRNPHPNAGKPGHPEASYVWHCVPCLVENRHRWASRAMRAEARVAELEKRHGPRPDIEVM